MGDTIEKMTRRERAAHKMADALIEWLHLMYNMETSGKILDVLIERLKKERALRKSIEDQRRKAMKEMTFP